MTLSINTNINSLTAQNNLSKSQSALSQATARLSSGLKINSASDNAAGYAIATNFTTQIGGLGQASSNASDAINLAQTTQSALSQVTANLQAIRDLAVQSANGSYTNTDRASIDTEVQQRLAEITRIANQTDFNGQKVLDGSLGTLSFQVGANVGQTISVNTGGGVKASQLGQVAEVSTGNISSVFSGSAAGLTLSTGQLTVNGTDVTGTFTTAAQLASAMTTAYGASGTGSGATFTANGSNQITIDDSADSTNAVTIGGSDAATLGLSTVAAGAAGSASTGVASAVTAAASTGPDLSQEGLSINGQTVDLTGATSLQNVSDAINAANISGVSAAVSGDGKGINLYSSDTTQGLTITDTKGNLIGANTTDANNASNTESSGSITAQVGGSLASGTVGSVDGANDLISRIDVALSSVSTLNSTLGAIQNRFESTISTLSAQSDNLSSSRSTIQDADFAAETADLSKANILQQAGISVLAQANSQPQQVLKLLQ